MTTSAPPRRHTGAIILALVILAAVAAAIWVVLTKRPETAVAARRDIIAYLPMEGKVAAPASAMANLSPPYQAPVSAIYVTVGKNVHRGDVLLELSAPTAQSYYEQAREQVRSAETALANARRQYQS